ncbi:response regulator [Alteromonas macleodii]|uniref:response regulator n=1 Tax=Alteromonas macleodii TaxID=28108 RepID=UPI003BF8AC2B
MRILIVDDSQTRSQEIRLLLENNLKICNENIDSACNAVEALQLMRESFYGILILDVVLPHRDEPPSARVGLNLLKDVTNRKNLNTPGRILGITSDIKEIDNYRREFENYFFTVIEAHNKNPHWKKRVVDSVEYAVGASLDGSTERGVLCFSVHGIESTGNWQGKLSKELSGHTDNVSFASYYYGAYSFLAFFLPFLRFFTVLMFCRKLHELLQREDNSNKEIVVFAHSFGTYIAVKGIERYIKKFGNINLKTIVLAGSVLKSNHSFKNIVNNTSCRVVNDAGYKDFPLVLSQLLVPFTGMAGRVGFFGFKDDKFTNRFFDGGHSLYFESDDFIKRYWLPILYDHRITGVDQRRSNHLRQFCDTLIRHLGNFKELAYFMILLWLIFN